MEGLIGPEIHNQKQGPAAFVLRAIDVSGDDVMDAVAPAGLPPHTVHQDVGKVEYPPRVANSVVANRDVNAFTDGTKVALLGAPIVVVPGGDQDRLAGLREAAPRVLEQVILKQYARGVLDFEVIFDDERMARVPTHETSRARLPLRDLVEVVAADRNVGGDDGCCGTSKENVLACRLEEVVLDLPGTTREIAAAASHGHGIRARPRNRRAVEIVQVRIHDRHIS